VIRPALLQTFFRNALILLALLALILAPRPAAGYWDSRQASRFEASGDYAAAAAGYALAAQRLPWQPSLWEKAARADLDAKEYSQAEHAFELADRYHALSPDGYVGWGDCAFALGKVEFALERWNAQLDQAGDPAALLARIAHGYQALALYANELQTWKRYLPYQPGDASAHYRLGLLLAASTPDEALPELMLAARLDPGLDPSVESLRTALNTATLSDDRAYQLLLSGRALGAMGNWDLAAEAFRNAIGVRADYAEAWAWLSEAKQQQGQAGSSEIAQALAFNPDSAMVESLYSLYLERQKQPKQALAAMQKAAALEPADPGWQMALGEAYEQAGDLISALQHYQQATEMAPDNATFWQALAEFSLRNSVDLAGTGLPAALKLVDLAKDDWQSYDLEGQILLETDDPDAAETALKKAVALAPAQAAPYLHLGILYMQTGDRAAALADLDVAKALDPGGPAGWQANRLLEQYFP